MKLNIASKIGALTFSMVLLSAGAVGFLVYTGGNSILVRQALADLGDEAHVAEVRLMSGIEALRQDVRFLAGAPPVQGILRAHNAGGVDPLDGSTEESWRQRLAGTFTEFLRAKPHYLQLRYIGMSDRGLELVRVDRLGESIVRVADEALQSKANMPYFQAAIQLKAGEVYLSDITLNREYGQVVKPHVPVLRAAVPVHFNEEKVFGIVIINMDFGPALAALDVFVTERVSLYVTNQTGDFLAHPNPEMNFGFDLEQGHRIQQFHPELAKLFEPANDDQETLILPTEASDAVVHFLKVGFDPLRPDRYLGLALAASYQDVVAESLSVRNRSILLTLLLIAVTTLLAFFFSRILVRPLLQITQATKGFSEGIFNVSLPLKAGGEIGVLARAFRTMVKQVQERNKAVRESEERLRSIYHAANDAIFVIDPQQDRIIETNPKACKMLEYSQDELTGMPVSKIHPNEMEMLSEFWQTILTNEVGWSDKLTCTTKTHRVIPAEISGSLLQVSGHKYMLAIVRDITERKQAEEAVQKSEEKYRTILESIEDGYYEVDISGNYTFFNDSLCKILGYSEDELMGMHSRDFTDSANAEKLEHTFNLVYTTGKPTLGFDWEIIRKDGSKRYVESSISLIEDAEGQGIGFRGIVRDISERKELEQQLLHAQKMETIGTLAGGVAHDFNNLLTVILGNAEFGMQDLESKGPVNEDFMEIEKAAIQAKDLTSQLLSFSRRQLLNPKLVNLNKAVEDLLKMLKRIIGENIELATKLAPNLALVWADPGQVQQVLMNLCVNARDAMPGGGKLTIVTCNFEADVDLPIEEDPEPTFGDDFPHFMDDSKNYVQITLTDSGVGMDAETQSRIFEPFFTTKKVGKGTGLGLSVVYGIIKQHHGRIEVDSRVRKGTTFRIYFPASSKNKAAAQRREKTKTLPGGKETILIVEDDAAVRKVTVRFIKGLGYNVLTAQDGFDAIKVFKAEVGKVDLAILDVVMPKVSGPEAYDKMRSIKPDLPVIFVTGYDIKAEIKNLRQRDQEFVTTLQKPYTTEILSKKVRELLDQG